MIVSNGTSTCDGDPLCQITLKSIHNCRNYVPDKLKAFADDTKNVNEVLKIGLVRVENIMGKGENTAYQHFLLFPRCFQKPSVSGS